jgi:hypothetical protein
MENKHKYKQFCYENQNIPVFSQFWWLDAVSQDGNWDVVLYEQDKKTIGAFPFFFKKKSIFNLITLPKFTQKLGPIIKDEVKDINKILDYFIDNLPSYNYLDINWHHTYKNWLPFYWKGFTQETMYSCIIKNLKNLDQIYENFNENRKRDIDKSQTNKLEINFDLDPEFFFDEHRKNLKKRNIIINYNKEFLKKIYNASSENNSGKLLGIFDQENNCLSICFLLWDKNYAYLIAVSSDPDKLKSGASSRLIYESLKFLNNKSQNFDFEGSMDKNIYNFYRSFGSEKYEFFKIRNFKPKILKTFYEIIK